MAANTTRMENAAAVAADDGDWEILKLFSALDGQKLMWVRKANWLLSELPH